MKTKSTWRILCFFWRYKPKNSGKGGGLEYTILIHTTKSTWREARSNLSNIMETFWKRRTVESPSVNIFSPRTYKQFKETRFFLSVDSTASILITWLLMGLTPPPKDISDIQHLQSGVYQVWQSVTDNNDSSLCAHTVQTRPRTHQPAHLTGSNTVFFCSVCLRTQANSWTASNRRQLRCNASLVQCHGLALVLRLSSQADDDESQTRTEYKCTYLSCVRNVW